MSLLYEQWQTYWELRILNPDALTVGDLIAGDSCTDVYEGILHFENGSHTEVRVTALRKNLSIDTLKPRQVREFKALDKLSDHSCVARFYGVVMKHLPDRSTKFCIVTERCFPGSLMSNI